MLVLGHGSLIEGLYIIISGRVEVLAEDDRGHQLIVAQLGENDIFGELGLVRERRSAERVEALTMCEILYVPRQAVLDCLQRNPPAAMSLLEVLTDRLSEARQKIASLGLQSASARVIEVLLEHGHQEHAEWRVDVGSETIAAMVGASREMVSRIVRKLIERGLVRRHKRKLIVIDRVRLAECGGSYAAARQESAHPSAQSGAAYLHPQPAA